MQRIIAVITRYLNQIYIPKSIQWTDILEILIIAFLVYHLLVWVKDTRSWSLVKGAAALFVFYMVAVLLNMTTILWIVRNVMSILVIALIIILQPEIRKGLEELGQRNIFTTLLRLEPEGTDGLFSDQTLNEIVRGSVEMSKVKTGALIVIGQRTPLKEYEQTGIAIDAVVTSQLLINIFEKNTPLHDGAVIISGDRVTAATCYLPLSGSRRIDKNLGTRHRAALGLSETTDAMAIVVSEETGHIAIAYRGVLTTDLSSAELKNSLTVLQNKTGVDEQNIRYNIQRRRGKGGRNA